MGKIFWKKSIDDYSTFSYKIEVDVSKDSFAEKILFFDALFLELGSKYFLFKYDDDQTIQNYITKRKKALQSVDPSISLLAMNQSSETGFNQLRTYLPNEEGELVPYTYSQGFLDIDFCGTYVQFIDLEDYDTKTIGICINSNSTIWMQDIQYGLDDSNDPLNFFPAIDNRFFAYRVTPRLNSFLCELKNSLGAIGGKISCDEEWHNYTTEDGIILDGKIIYQKDIESGLYVLPEKNNIYPWKRDVYHFDAFNYDVILPVNRFDCLEKTLKFNRIFVENGHRLGIFKFRDPDKMLELTNKDKMSSSEFSIEQLKLLDFPKNIGMTVDSSKIELSDFDGKLKEFDYGYITPVVHSFQSGIPFNDPNMEGLLTLTLQSESNVWFDTIEDECNDNKEPVLVQRIIDNRYFAYRVTPRFNSFLRILREELFRMGGTIEFSSYKPYKNSTENGILLDGKIIYQEDIDNGSVQLPE